MLSCYFPPRWISATALACGLATSASLVTPGHEYQWVTYPALLLIVGCLIALSQKTKLLGYSRLIRTAADYSFTLYLIHYAIMLLFYFVIPKAKGWGRFLLAVGIANVAAYLIARPFEMKHRKFAEWISEKVGLQANEEPGVTALTDPRRAVAQPHPLVGN